MSKLHTYGAIHLYSVVEELVQLGGLICTTKEGGGQKIDKIALNNYEQPLNRFG